MIADDGPPEGAFSTAAATVGRFDSLKKFIRTAELGFQVKNAIAATLEIEQVAAKNGGFTLASKLENQNSYQNITPISRDSAIQTTYLDLKSSITLRVPFQKLDTALREMGRLSTLFNCRRVRAEDVSLNFIENEMARLRLGSFQQDLGEIKAEPGNAAAAKVDAAQRAFDAKSAADRARLDDLKMADAIRFSTVQVEIYQPLETRQKTIANPEKLEAKPGFLFRLGNSLASGWAILADLLFGVLSLWPIWLLLVGGFLFFKKWRKSK